MIRLHGKTASDPEGEDILRYDRKRYNRSSPAEHSSTAIDIPWVRVWRFCCELWMRTSELITFVIYAANA